MKDGEDFKEARIRWCGRMNEQKMLKVLVWGRSTGETPQGGRVGFDTE